MTLLSTYYVDTHTEQKGVKGYITIPMIVMDNFVKQKTQKKKREREKRVLKNLVSSLKNVSLGLGTPRPGPTDQFLPGQPDRSAPVLGPV